MARQQASFVENKFIKGLITQTTEMSFPTDACTETWNCVFDETGLVTRRPSFDIEDGYTSITQTVTPGDAWTEFQWTNVGSNEDRSLFVQQQGTVLYFFDVTSSSTVSANQKPFSINLEDISDSTDIASRGCQFAQGNGHLFVVHPFCPPIYVEYNEDVDNITYNIITLKIRDFKGLDDGLDLKDRPVYSVATLKTGNPSHYYNLLNQGWHYDEGSSLAAWDTARNDVPSNSDFPTYYRKANDDAFNATLVTENDAGGTPAPKGHFILEFGIEDRNTAMTDENFTGATVPSGEFERTLITTTGLTTIGNYTNPSFAFDMDSSETIAESATKTGTTGGYIGVNLSSSAAIHSAVVYGPSDGILTSSPFVTVTFTLYGANSSPGTATSGTVLGTYSSSSFRSGEAFTIESSDTTTAYAYIWVTMTTGSSVTIRVAEVFFYKSATSYNYPSTITFFNNRIFYGGWSHPALAPYILFTQVLEDSDQYGYCYQLNDPTSDKLADLLATDGGTVKIPEMGFVQIIRSFQTQILVVSSNGVWIISGGSDNIFSATGYQVRKISSIGSRSPFSCADIKGLPAWWAEDGIYTAGFDPNYNSVTIKSITEETIKDFYLTLSERSRQHAKVTYDKLNDVVYWLYNSGDPDSTEYWDYDSVLCFNAKSGAFYPWEIQQSSTNPQIIHGLYYVQDGERLGDYAVKFPITYSVSSVDKLSYADVEGTTYKDWTDYATSVTSTAGDEEDFSSYFIAGYRVDGEGMRNFQANYFFLFMKKEANASAMVQGLYDFSDSSSSVKWSTAQQGYNSFSTTNQSHRSVRIKKMLIRGHGRAVQIKVYSETGKPFSIIALGYYETANSGV